MRIFVVHPCCSIYSVSHIVSMLKMPVKKVCFLFHFEKWRKIHRTLIAVTRSKARNKTIQKQRWCFSFLNDSFVLVELYECIFFSTFDWSDSLFVYSECESWDNNQLLNMRSMIAQPIERAILEFSFSSDFRLSTMKKKPNVQQMCNTTRRERESEKKKH